MRGTEGPARAEGAGGRWSGRVLVVGIGNDLRGDDGAGIRVSERLARGLARGRWSGRVRTMARRHLTPELAEDFGRFEVVVVADASVSGGRARLERLRGSGDDDDGEDGEGFAAVFPGGLSHGCDARALARLAVALGGRAPELWWLSIPGRSWETGAELSVECRRAVAAGLRLLRGKLPDPFD